MAGDREVRPVNEHQRGERRQQEKHAASAPQTQIWSQHKASELVPDNRRLKMSPLSLFLCPLIPNHCFVSQRWLVVFSYFILSVYIVFFCVFVFYFISVRRVILKSVRRYCTCLH